jgi:L-iditol 2-dehydrogenase
MQQLISPTPGVVEVIETPIPTIGEGELLVRLTLCGLCGTDMMKIYDPGAARPARLGHEVVATIAEVGNGVSSFQLGQRIGLVHHVPDYSSHYTRRGSETMDTQFQRTNIDPCGLAEYIRLPALLVENSVLALPDDLSDERAVFLEPLCCVLRSLERIRITAGDTILLIGAGAIGTLFLPLLCDRAATVLVSDARAERLAVAQRWGAIAGFVAGRDDAAAGAHEYSQGRGADIVILTVVNRATLALALQAVRDGGTLLLFGVKPDAQYPVDFWQLWRRELNLITSYAATPALLPQALAILRRPAYAFEELISHRVPLRNAAAGIALMHDGAASKVVITP